ncbi:MAG TPA: hypothetical protein VE111_18035 [Bradyrhizobium sp.]|nr:hypothetical protein [Bradyrhizobium sp.]
MNVFIANFGRENYEWPRCLELSTVATMNAEAVHDFWERNDRDGYINYCMRHLKTASGISPTRPVASRWFNLMTIISETAGDVWIHREKEQLWWTVSKPLSPTITLENDPLPLQGAPRVYVCRKPCAAWSSTNRLGNRLEWNTLHPKAKDFLFTEGTLQKLSPDHAEYALALVDGTDRSRWHEQLAWKRKASTAKADAGTVFNARQKTIAEMALTATGTAARSNGQQELRTIKNKEVRFSVLEFERYISALIDAQDGLCAVTGLKLQFKGEHDDPELLCSLDRIESDGHYEAGNLQVVCRFVNRWKNNAIDAEFRRLIRLVQASIPA